jgi:hypothetical protein
MTAAIRGGTPPLEISDTAEMREEANCRREKYHRTQAEAVAWHQRQQATSHPPTHSPTGAGVVAGVLVIDALDDVRDDLRNDLAQIKAATSSAMMTHAGFDVFAKMLMARLEPRLTLLEERAAKLEAILAGIGSTLSVISRQQASMRRKLR